MHSNKLSIDDWEMVISNKISQGVERKLLSLGDGLSTIPLCMSSNNEIPIKIRFMGRSRKFYGLQAYTSRRCGYFNLQLMNKGLIAKRWCKYLDSDF